ncbi:DUF2799 domain-containing protein [Simiduia aestuariiviva]|uniref:DUF2799 domain-containing protein n=1 Tax=Simiduia aestuariiviva TaxID=1510459 RepID=A0A839UNP3_9GAMM|nr:DUF2799 domain-containing protein [Simiduia aestuariiviva]MBB3167188.1 hypothetical protein [Simiduia aestuariiviva]
MNKYLCLGLILLISGCATMNKEECQLADWQAVGYKHGAQGQSATSFNQYQADCADHNIKADFGAFKRGHQAGLDEYCSYETGLRLGSSGSNYNGQCSSRRYEDFASGYQEGVSRYCTYESGYDSAMRGHGMNRNCPEARYPEYSQGHMSGQARYALEQSVRALESELADIEHSMLQQDEFIADSEAVIVSAESSADDRVKALLDIKNHRDERKRLKREYRRVEVELEALHAQLNDI